MQYLYIHISMDWVKGKSTGNHRFSHYLWGFPVNFPSNQSIEYIYIYIYTYICVFMIYDMGIGWLILIDTKLTKIRPKSVAVPFSNPGVGGKTGPPSAKVNLASTSSRSPFGACQTTTTAAGISTSEQVFLGAFTSQSFIIQQVID
jgi:hypothetical protein